MPAKRETIRQIRQMLRLHHDGVSAREIGRTLGLARSTIQDNLERAEKAGIGWPLAPGLTDGILEDRLFAKAGFKPGQRRRTEPDWVALARELKRPGVNLMILWEEYRDAHPEGYGYSRFCDLFREFERRLTPVMRQHHAAGDKVFVDYSGKRVPIADPATGEVRMAEIFVASAHRITPTPRRPSRSNYPTGSERMSACSAFFAVCLNSSSRTISRAASTSPRSGIPEVNRSYAKMAAHYDVGASFRRDRESLATRLPSKPGCASPRAISLGGCAIEPSSHSPNAMRRSGGVERMNTRPMRVLGSAAGSCSRPSSSRRCGRCRRPNGNMPNGGSPASGSIITSRLKASITRCRTRSSAPKSMCASRIVEIFHRGKRVAAHQRRYSLRHGTEPDHMPTAHRRYAEWSPSFSRWARTIGPNAEGLIIAVLANRPHPEQGFRTCLGILRLYRGIGGTRRPYRHAPSNPAPSIIAPSPPSSPTISTRPPPPKAARR